MRVDIPSVLAVEALPLGLGLGFADGAASGRHAASGCRMCGGAFGLVSGARLGNLRDEAPAAFEADDPIVTVCIEWRGGLEG